MTQSELEIFLQKELDCYFENTTSNIKYVCKNGYDIGIDIKSNGEIKFYNPIELYNYNNFTEKSLKKILKSKNYIK